MASLQTVTLTPTSNSGAIQSNTTTNSYQQARVVGENLNKTTFNSGQLGQYATPPSFSQTVGAIEFDLSVLPTNAVITDIVLSLYGASHTPNTPAGSPNLLIIQYDWGSALTTGDWINLDTLKNNPLTYPVLGQANYFDFPDTSVTSIGGSFLINQTGLNYVNTQVAAGLPARFWLVNQDSLNGTEFDSLGNDKSMIASFSNPTLQVTYYLRETVNPSNDKRYQYQVYDSSGNYLTTWSDVISEPMITQEINSAGSEVRLVLQRDPETLGTDITLNNKVVITVFDKETPSGLILYQGFISQYNTVYEDKNKNLEIILLGYGSTLSNIVAEEINSTGIDVNYPKDGSSITFAFNTNTTYLSLKFKADGFDFVNVIHFYMDSVAIPASVDVCSDVNGIPGASIIPTDQNCTLKLINLTAPGVYDIAYSLPPGLILESGKSYHFIWKPGTSYTPNIYKHAADQYINGGYLLSTNGTSWALQSGDLDFRIEPAVINTSVSFTNTDPAEILKSILDVYNLRGGPITYGGASIEPTGEEVDYTFKAINVLDAINKCLALSPTGFYWYIDQATNTFNFKKLNVSPDNTFSFGKDIVSLNLSTTAQPIVNTVYFTGGDTGGGVNFYKKYTDIVSVNLYGIKSQFITDNRVTLTATADKLASRILTDKSYPKLQANINITDSSLGNLGFDIESVKVGQVIAFKSIGGSLSSYWDQALWDQSYWDMNYKDLGTLRLQIGRITYSPSGILIEAVDLPINQSTKIETQGNAIGQINTVNNPTNPV